jgi:hypothetical protein
MKKLLFITFSLIVVGNSIAQSPNKWLDSGSEWHYKIWYWMFQYPEGFNRYYYAQDTVINNVTFEQVKREQQLRYDNGNGTYTLGDTTYLSSFHFLTSNDTVYLLDNNNSLQFMWYNNPNVGDIWDFGIQFDWYTNTFIHAYSQVDSIKFITINGKQTKEIYSHSVKDLSGTPVQLGDTALFVDHVEIINTKFGPIRGFNKIGQFISPLIFELPISDELLCFESDSFPFYQVYATINCNNNIILGIIENDIYNFHIFPNPVNDNLNISFTHIANKEIKIELFNSLGQVVKTISKVKLLTGKNEINFSVADLTKGIYHLKFSVDDEVVVKRVVKM